MLPSQWQAAARPQAAGSGQQAVPGGGGGSASASGAAMSCNPRLTCMLASLYTDLRRSVTWQLLVVILLSTTMRSSPLSVTSGHTCNTERHAAACSRLQGPTGVLQGAVRACIARHSHSRPPLPPTPTWGAHLDGANACIMGGNSLEDGQVARRTPLARGLAMGHIAGVGRPACRRQCRSSINTHALSISSSSPAGSQLGSTRRASRPNASTH